MFVFFVVFFFYESQEPELCRALVTPTFSCDNANIHIATYTYFIVQNFYVVVLDRNQILFCRIFELITEFDML